MQIPHYFLYLIIAIILELFSLYSTFQYYQETFGNGFTAMLCFPLFWVLLLSTELFYYFKVKDKISRHDLAQRHCLLLFLAFLLVPVLKIILNFTIPHMSEAVYKETMFWYKNIQLYAVVFLLIVSHYFFIKVIKQVKNEPYNPDLE